MNNKYKKVILDIDKSNNDKINTYELREIDKLLNNASILLPHYNKDIKILTKQIASINKIFKNSELIQLSRDAETIQDYMENVNKYVENIFIDGILSPKDIEILKLGEFRKGIFDAIPASFITVIKKLRTPTLNYLKNCNNINLDTDKMLFVTDGNIELNTNEINELALISNATIEFTQEEIIEMLELFKADQMGFINTEYYKRLSEYVSNSACFKYDNSEFYYRGSRNDTNVDYDEKRMRNSSVGYPTMGRFNFTGVNYLYVSNKKIGPKCELLKHNNDEQFVIQLAQFENKEEYRIFDIDCEHMDVVLKNQITSILIEDGKSLKDQYVISSIFADSIKRSKQAAGIMYEDKCGYVNYVFYDTNLFVYSNLGRFSVEDILE